MLSNLERNKEFFSKLNIFLPSEEYNEFNDFLNEIAEVNHEAYLELLSLRTKYELYEKYIEYILNAQEISMRKANQEANRGYLAIPHFHNYMHFVLTKVAITLKNKKKEGLTTFKLDDINGSATVKKMLDNCPLIIKNREGEYNFVPGISDNLINHFTKREGKKQSIYIKKDKKDKTRLELADGPKIILVNSLVDLNPRQIKALSAVDPQIQTILSKNQKPKKTPSNLQVTLQAPVLEKPHGDAPLPEAPLSEKPAHEKIAPTHYQQYLGKGAFGKVILGMAETNGEITFYAIKKMEVDPKDPKAETKERSLKEEAKLNEILRDKKIPSTIAAKATVVRKKEDNQNKYYLVLPLAPSGDGENYIENYRKLGKSTYHAENWQGLTKDLTQSLIAQQQANIVNFDIKPANILLNNDPKNPDRKIASFSDFGCAHYINEKGEYISVSGQTDFHYLPANFGETVKAGLSKNAEGLEKRKVIDKFRYGLTLLFLLDPQAEEIYKTSLDQAVKASGMNLVQWHLATGSRLGDDSFTEFKKIFFQKIFDVIEQMLLDKNKINPDIIRGLLNFIKNPDQDLKNLCSLSEKTFYLEGRNEGSDLIQVNKYITLMKESKENFKQTNPQAELKVISDDKTSYDYNRDNGLDNEKVLSSEDSSYDSEGDEKNIKNISNEAIFKKEEAMVDMEDDKIKDLATQTFIGKEVLQNLENMFKTIKHEDNLALIPIKEKMGNEFKKEKEVKDPKTLVNDVLHFIMNQSFKVYSWGNWGGKRVKINSMLDESTMITLEKNLPTGVYQIFKLITAEKQKEKEGKAPNWIELLKEIRKIAAERKDTHTLNIWSRLWRDESTFLFYKNVFDEIQKSGLFRTEDELAKLKRNFISNVTFKE